MCPKNASFLDDLWLTYLLQGRHALSQVPNIFVARENEKKNNLNNLVKERFINQFEAESVCT